MVPTYLEDAPKERLYVLKDGLAFNEKEYAFDDKFKPMSGDNPLEAHTVPELVHVLSKKSNIEIDARFLGSDGHVRRLEGGKSFVEYYKSSDQKWNSQTSQKLVEAKRSIRRLKENDWFATNTSQGFGTVNSDDFLPLLGGPFFKQLYPYDYLRMIAASYYAWNHDPVAKATIGIMLDFVLGRGFTVNSDNSAAQIVWDAFYKVNNGDKFWANHYREKKIYGESMIWMLPKNETFISWQRSPEQEPPRGIIPRVRLIDPSCIWDIITFPEDIEDVIAYQWVAPTQYQTYTAPGVPSLKFIFTQIPANQVFHEKSNAVSNEKRGRSDLFASLGYYKRLRDTVNYSIVSEQKAAAWSIDTTVDGNQGDLNAYVASQQALGTLPPAGSEFIHSKKIDRKYLGNTASKTGQSSAFDWCMSMCAMGARIPVSYYGTHISGGQTRASSIVATEPVAKMFERERLDLENTVKKVHYWLTGADCKVIWPELITQDRSAKIKDLSLAKAEGTFSARTTAEMMAKEFGVQDYDFDAEAAMGAKEQMVPGETSNPLTDPGDAKPTLASGLNGEYKNGVKNNDR
jgi:hypothetical protein